MATISRFQLNAIVRALLASGGIPSRPWSVAGQMQVGMNTAAPGNYNARRFANILYDMSSWAPVNLVGGGARTPGTWSQTQGTLIGDGDGSGTDGKYFRATVCAKQDGLPAGVYTVFNPCAQEIAIGSFSGVGIQTWTTAKYFTFSYTPSSSGIFLWCRRSLQNTGAGNLQIILPGAVGNGTVDTTNGTYLTDGTAGITSGNIWAPDFITFCTGLSLQRERWMAALRVIGSYEVDWTDRVLPTGISLTSKFQPTGNVIPHEFVIDFSNRFGIDPWINMPVMSTPAYWASCASLYQTGLNASRRVLPEYSNENWNYAAAYNEDSNWVGYLQYTKYFATVSDLSNPSAPVFQQTAHGRSVGDVLALFPTRENAIAGSAIYYMQQAYSYTISAVSDANHFTLDLTGRTAPAGLVNIQYAWTGEPGKSNAGTIPDQNHATQQLAIWDTFDAALGSARVVHSCASQASNSSVTTNRMNTGAMAARAEHVHTAPYYSGLYWRAVFTGGGSQITPSIWTSAAGTVWFGIYAAGSTPSALDITRGVGTGFISGSTQVIGSNFQSATGPAVTGLVDGTNYAAFAVFKESATGYFWKIGTGTDALNPANVKSTVAAGAQYCYDTFANQAARCRLSQVSTSNELAHNAAIAAVGSSATLITYEGGPDFNGGQPTDLSAWLLSNYYPSTAHVSTFTHSYNHLARAGFRGHNHYLDCVGGGSVPGAETPYDLVPNTLFSATAVDGRYAAVAAFGGSVAARSAFPSTVTTNKTAAAITSAPGSFPYTVYSGLPAGYTYSIVSGDWTGNFAISGTSVIMNNATGISFAGYSPETLTIEANDGYSSTTFNLSVPIGSAWYEADAQYVWDSVGASAGATMTSPSNPPFASYGSALSRVTGTGNPVITSSSGTVTNDLWKMSSYVFANTSANTASIPFYDASNNGIPLLVAHLVDIGDQATTASQYEVGISQASSSISFGTPSVASQTKWRVYIANTSVATVSDGTCPAKGTKAVHWVYIDPANSQIVAGINQTVGSTTTATIPSGSAMGKDLRIGSNNGSATSFSQMYHGSLQVLSRPGLTQTQALAIVQKMQTHHGI